MNRVFMYVENNLMW